MVVYYIGPESKVYHLNERCQSLKTEWRYWPLHRVNGLAAEQIVRKRRLCKFCEKGK